MAAQPARPKPRLIEKLLEKLHLLGSVERKRDGAPFAEDADDYRKAGRGHVGRFGELTVGRIVGGSFCSDMSFRLGTNSPLELSNASCL